MPRTSSGMLRSAFAVGLIALLICGCGHTERVGSNRTLAVALTEYRLNPKDATVSAGTLTIVVRNYGRLSHNLVVAQNGQWAGFTKAIPPGESSVIVMSVTRGTYTMSSTILSDAALGAYGNLKVN